MRVLLEVAVDSLADAVTAARLVCDRLELCTALDRHGLSADPSTVRDVVRDTRLPTVAMIRPHASSFTASERDVLTMQREAEALLDAGASGLVFGVLTAEHSIDVAACRAITQVARGTTLVFHRAFDLVADSMAAAEQLIDLGFARILTTGMTGTRAAASLQLEHVSAPPDSLEVRLGRLGALAVATRGRIDILPCGSIRADNVGDVWRTLRCSAVHSACRAAGKPSLDAGMLIALRAAVDRLA